MDRFCDVCGKASPPAHKAETTAVEEQRQPTTTATPVVMQKTTKSPVTAVTRTASETKGHGERVALTSQGKRVVAFLGLLLIILVALFIVPQALYESSHRVPVENGTIQCVLGATGPTFDPVSQKELPPCPPSFSWNTFMLQNLWILAFVIFVIALAAVATFMPRGHSGETVTASIVCKYCGGNASPRSSFCPHCDRALV
jgi:hypothetical protein